MSRGEEKAKQHRERIIKLVAEHLNVSTSVVSERINFEQLEESGADSLDVVEMAIELEEEFPEDFGRHET